MCAKLFAVRVVVAGTGGAGKQTDSSWNDGLADRTDGRTRRPAGSSGMAPRMHGLSSTRLWHVHRPPLKLAHGHPVMDEVQLLALAVHLAMLSDSGYSTRRFLQRAQTPHPASLRPNLHRISGTSHHILSLPRLSGDSSRGGHAAVSRPYMSPSPFTSC